MDVASIGVVGLGPAGIIAAATLGRSGHRVTAIQADAGVSNRSVLASPPPTLRSDPSEEAILQTSPPAGRDAIGGAKLLAAPQAYRLDAATFRARTAAERRYGPLPAGHGLVDWPIDIEDVEPWYRRVEQVTEVGVRASTAWTARMTAAAQARNWQPFAAPAAARADASGLLEGSGTEIVPGVVTAVLQSSTGAARGLEYIDVGGATRMRSFDAVVVAASVVPTVRLLLLSGMRAGGRVGRWFSSHNTFVVHGDFAGIDLERRRAGPASAVAIADFEGDRFDHTGLGFFGGSLLQAAMTGPWSRSRRAAATVGLSARTTGRADAAAWVDAHHRSIGSVWAQPDHVPGRAHLIDLDPAHTDPAGRPVARLTFALADDDRRRWEFLSARAREWLTAAGARSTWQAPLEPQPLGTHLYGGTRMGDDPAASVVDAYGRFHGVPGLIVVGSSTFPSAGGRGPVETIEALAWRSAARLSADLR